MLRISQVNGPDLNPTLKVEGKLRGPWVAELASRACDADLQAFSRKLCASDSSRL